MNKLVIHKYLHEIFEDIENSENRAEAAEKLVYYNKNLPPKHALAMRDLLKVALDERIVIRLPVSTPPYRPCGEHNAPSNVFNEMPKFRFLVDNLQTTVASSNKREKIFLGMLESIHPKDAEILVNAIKKKIDYKHMTPTTVRLAFGDEPFFVEDKLIKEGKLKRPAPAITQRMPAPTAVAEA